MTEIIRYGVGGERMVDKVQPVEKTPKPKKKKQEPLQEILEVNPNAEDDGAEDQDV